MPLVPIARTQWRQSRLPPFAGLPQLAIVDMAVLVVRGSPRDDTSSTRPPSRSIRLQTDLLAPDSPNRRMESPKHTPHASDAPTPEFAAAATRAGSLRTQGFFAKVKRVVGYVPFARDAVAMYFCAADDRTPTYVKTVIFAALAYFALPADAIPDFVAGLGFTDDASAIATTLAAINAHLREEHRERAAAFFAGEEGTRDRPEGAPEDLPAALPEAGEAH